MYWYGGLNANQCVRVYWSWNSSCGCGYHLSKMLGVVCRWCKELVVWVWCGMACVVLCECDVWCYVREWCWWYGKKKKNLVEFSSHSVKWLSGQASEHWSEDSHLSWLYQWNCSLFQHGTDFCGSLRHQEHGLQGSQHDVSGVTTCGCLEEVLERTTGMVFHNTIPVGLWW